MSSGRRSARWRSDRRAGRIPVLSRRAGRSAALGRLRGMRLSMGDHLCLGVAISGALSGWLLGGYSVQALPDAINHAVACKRVSPELSASGVGAARLVAVAGCRIERRCRPRRVAKPRCRVTKRLHDVRKSRSCTVVGSAASLSGARRGSPVCHSSGATGLTAIARTLRARSAASCAGRAMLAGNRIVVIRPADNTEMTLWRTHAGIPRDLAGGVVRTDDGLG